MFSKVTNQQHKAVTPLISKRRFAQAVEMISQISNEQLRHQTLQRHLSTLIKHEPDRCFDLLESETSLPIPPQMHAMMMCPEHALKRGIAYI